MKRILILTFVAALALPVFGQQTKEERKAAKEAKKEQQKKEEAERAAVIGASIDAKQFVLEANFLSDKYGQRAVVDPILNFIGIDVEKSAFQFGNGRDVGYNGVGGVTVEGNVKNYKVSKNKKGMYSIEFNVSASFGNIFVVMTVSPTGAADATISGNTSTKLKYTGNLVPMGESRVYKGSRSL